MKKITTLLLTISLLLTTGCLGTDTTNQTENPLYYKYGSTSFSVEIPNDWEVINQFTSDYPTNTIVAFRNNLKDQKFIANVNLVANAVSEDMNNGDFGIEMLQKHESDLIDYRLIEQQEINILVNGTETPTYLNYFEGRNSLSSDLLRFIQVYGVNNGFGYVTTATFLPEEDEFIIENCVHIVKSLELR